MSSGGTRKFTFKPLQAGWLNRKGQEMKKYLLFFQVIILAAAMCQPAFAQGDISGTPWERFSVSLGYLTAASDSDVRIGRDALGTGISIDVEDALNLDTTHSATNLDVKYR